jgi:putative flippase GtrA
MTPLQRWTRFTLVGALGMAVQLFTLAMLNRVFPGHYLTASAIALELTLLHNAAWHLLYTWRDRAGNTSGMHRLLRFHFSNGLVSLFGNLILMRLLVHNAHLPVIPANLIAILCCSIANFSLGDRWVFAKAHDHVHRTTSQGPVAQRKRRIQKALPH